RPGRSLEWSSGTALRGGPAAPACGVVLRHRPSGSALGSPTLGAVLLLFVNAGGFGAGIVALSVSHRRKRIAGRRDGGMGYGGDRRPWCGGKASHGTWPRRRRNGGRPRTGSEAISLEAPGPVRRLASTRP